MNNRHDSVLTEENNYLQQTGVVFNLQRFSLHDGPGIRTIVFFKGCPLRCHWCSNPESQKYQPELIFNQSKCLGCEGCIRTCPEGAISFASISSQPEQAVSPSRKSSLLWLDRVKCTGCGGCVKSCPSEALYMEGYKTTVKDILEEVMKDSAFYKNSSGGITLSGGEVLAQPDFAYALLYMSKQYGIHTVVETAGYASFEALHRIMAVTDIFLYDLKHYDEAKHLYYTGVKLTDILENLQSLLEAGAEVILRIPVIPEVNDSEEDAKHFGQLLKSMGIKKVNLLPFHQLGEYKYNLLQQNYAFGGKKVLKDEDVEDYKQMIASYGLEVTIGG